FNLIMSPLLSLLLLFPLSVISIIPPLIDQEDAFKDAATFPEFSPGSQQQNFVPAASQTAELNVPEFPAAPRTSNKMRGGPHNGPPGFMPPKAVEKKMRDELTKDVDENSQGSSHLGFVTRKGRARVLGISRRRPDFATRRQL
ncbi:hypothetical protein PFISCL1PPCAC_5973, partial [Pristionchus fissidentatus]